jgi:hypothetical protein
MPKLQCFNDDIYGTQIKNKIKFSLYIRKFRVEHAVATSQMRKGFLIYEEMHKCFPIYEEAVCHDFATTLL